ncbi:MAG: hypothetical protein V4667_04355 [Bacteroidota bacterium]
MKNLILGLAVVLATSLTVSAQEKQPVGKEAKVAKENPGKGKKEMKGKSAEQRADAITKRMMKVTGASAVKEPKVKEINLATEKQREADRTTNANNKDGLKVAHKKRNLERETKLKEVFSAEEYAKWVAHKKEMKAKQKAKKQDAKKAKTEVEDEIQEAIED